MSSSSGSRREEIPLPQYAAVQAALAEGFPLSEILAAEGISAAEWDEDRAVWEARIARDADIQRACARELADAEDHLARKVTPIDSDPLAWVAFLAAFKGEVREETLKKTALRPTDVSRLTRCWARRSERDPKLGKKLTALLAELEKAGRVDLPALHIEPLRLKPSSLARARPREASPATTPLHDRSAEIALAPPALPAPPAAPPSVAGPPEPAGIRNLAGTADISAFVPRNPLPFLPVTVGTPPPSPVAAPPSAPPAPPAPPAGHELARTADISAYFPRGLLPFTPPAPAPPQVPPPVAPRVRLVRFDPQTGQPLAQPRWEELPPDPPSREPGKR